MGLFIRMSGTGEPGGVCQSFERSEPIGRVERLVGERRHQLKPCEPFRCCCRLAEGQDLAADAASGMGRIGVPRPNARRVEGRVEQFGVTTGCLVAVVEGRATAPGRRRQHCGGQRGDGGCETESKDCERRQEVVEIGGVEKQQNPDRPAFGEGGPKRLRHPL